MDFVEFLIGGVEEEQSVHVEEVGVLAELAAGGGVTGVGGLAGFDFDEGDVRPHLYYEIGAHVVLRYAVIDVHRGALKGLAREDGVALRKQEALCGFLAVAGELHSAVEDVGFPPASNEQREIGRKGDEREQRKKRRISGHEMP